MNKTILKHLSIILSVVLLVVLIWFLFVYVFFDNELKKSIYPLIDDSKQMLSEIVSKDFAIDKTKRFISEFEKNEYIRYLIVKNKQDKPTSTKVDSVILSVLKLSYPIKSGNAIVGWVEVWPSYELFSKIFSSGTNITILLLSIIFLLVIFIFVAYIYIKKYVFTPFKQIKTMINSIVLNKEINIDETNEYGIWKNIFLDLKKLYNKVFDINTTMNLLLSATSGVNSDLEFVNSIHTIFNIVQKRIKNSMCVLFVPDESGQLKVFVKNGLLDNNMTFVPQTPRNYIWKTYSDTTKIIINDSNKISKDSIGNLCSDTIGSFVSIPLVDSNKTCKGVFCVITRLEKSFNVDNMEIIDSISKYLASLINRIEDYRKIKDINRKLEIEVETTSKELIDTNSVLIRKTRDVRNMLDMFFYTTTKNSVDDSIDYVMKKIEEILYVENFGVFIYDENDNVFSSVKGSFGFDSSLKIASKNGIICKDVIDKDKYVIINDKLDLDGYSNDPLLKKTKLKSALLLPIKKEGKIIAISVAINKINSKFNLSDAKILEHISIIIYGIIDKMNLYNKAKVNITMGETNGNR